MSYVPGQPVTAVVQRVEIHKLRQGENLILGFSIGGGIDQDPAQNPFSEDKTDKGIYVTRVSEGGPAEVAGLQIGDKIMQVRRRGPGVVGGGGAEPQSSSPDPSSPWLSPGLNASAQFRRQLAARCPKLGLNLGLPDPGSAWGPSAGCTSWGGSHSPDTVLTPRGLEHPMQWVVGRPFSPALGISRAPPRPKYSPHGSSCPPAPGVRVGSGRCPGPGGPQGPQPKAPEGRRLCPQVNGWDMTMVTHDQARKRLTKRNEEVVRLLVTRQGLQKAVQQSMLA
uniref:Tax1-binding protein 3 n=1 Tax=Sarcophilus harrisii TaxID=9305 RepID=A0A7N4PRS6_SARHA